MDSPKVWMEDVYLLPNAVYQLPTVTSLEFTHSGLGETVALGWDCLIQLTLTECLIDNLGLIIRQSGIRVLSLRSCYRFEHLLIDSRTLIDFTLDQALVLDSLTFSTPHLECLCLFCEINITSFTIRASPCEVEAGIDFSKNTD